ncbi:MAG TPA: hypothetical protein VK253_08885 [Candidatus Binatia bacterium]|nr:hypothetical protein [Candidatus Binatia bacterium]
MPNLKILTAAVFTVLILVSIAAPVLAVTYKPGVTTGQYVKYGNFVGTGPGLEDFSNYDAQTVQVTNVAGSQVTLLTTGQYKNGTATPGNGTVNVWDVAAGTEDGTQKTQGPIIATNLKGGDSIPPPDTYAVNSTENRQYLGTTRSSNILSITLSTPDYNSSLTYIYDKASGMLLESSSQTTVQGESGPVTSEYSYSITQTNIFYSTPTNPIQEIPLGTIGILAIAIIFVAFAVVLILFRKRI